MRRGKTERPVDANPGVSPRQSPSSDAACSAEIVAWRRRRLAAAGFAADLAAELARSHDIDLHAVLELVDRGCPPALAARILAPLDSSTTGRSSP